MVQGYHHNCSNTANRIKRKTKHEQNVYKMNKYQIRLYTKCGKEAGVFYSLGEEVEVSRNTHQNTKGF